MKLQILKYAAAIIFVFATGVTAWAINEFVYQGDEQPKREETLEWRSQVIGWTSAALYCEPQCYFFFSHLLPGDRSNEIIIIVGARIPQIRGVPVCTVCCLRIDACCDSQKHEDQV